MQNAMTDELRQKIQIEDCPSDQGLIWLYSFLSYFHLINNGVNVFFNWFYSKFFFNLKLFSDYYSLEETILFISCLIIHQIIINI